MIRNALNEYVTDIRDGDVPLKTLTEIVDRYTD